MVHLFLLPSVPANVFTWQFIYKDIKIHLNFNVFNYSSFKQTVSFSTQVKGPHIEPHYIPSAVRLPFMWLAYLSLKGLCILLTIHIGTQLSISILCYIIIKK